VTPLETALAYAARGWRVVPIPAGEKFPKGLADWAQRATTEHAQIVQWWPEDTTNGIGIATGTQTGFFALDVDPRHGGDDTLADLEHEHGRLPDTIESLTGGGGRHICFRMPDGATITNDQAGRLGPGLDIRGEGGQIVVPPTIHPNGTPYEWEALSDPFDGAELAEAPSWLIELLTNDPTPLKPRRAARRSTQLLSDRPGDRFEVDNEWADLLERDGWTLHSGRNGRQGDYELWTRPGKDPREGASASLYYGGTDLLKVFTSSVAGLDADATYTRFGYHAATRHGGDHAAAARALGAQQRTATPKPVVDVDTGEIEQDWRNLPDEFWSARDCLAHVRQAAHSRSRCADSVLVAVMARVATLIPHTVVLPAIVGSTASLNFFGAIVGRSGGGKSTSKDVACELVPIEHRKDILPDVSPGSGEGLVEMYFEMVDEVGDDGKKRKVKRKTKNAAFVFVDEGQGLLSMSERSGATIMPIMRSAWSGATLGQQNASQETNRRLPAHSYRMAMVLGFQLAYAASLIADAEGGTPQRFVFVNATDPTIPDERPQWPGPLDLTPLPIVSTGTTVAFDPDIVEQIRRRALGATRGEWEVDPLDTHADLGRMKVAAILAVMDGGRLCVGVDDWELAGMVMRSSRAVRTWAIEEARSSTAASERSTAMRLAQRQIVVEDASQRRALEAGALSIARKAHRDPTIALAKRDVMSAVRGSYKKLVTVDEMIDLAIANGWIEAIADGFRAGKSRPV
jgi:hypothetical protein